MITEPYYVRIMIRQRTMMYTDFYFQEILTY